MPVIKSAVKKLRHDINRTQHNDNLRAKLRDAMRKVRKGSITASEAYSVVDKTAKLNLIHSNKAARLKSSISKTLGPTSKKPSKTKKASKKSPTVSKSAKSRKKASASA